jgi:tight adherence protein C
VIFLIVASTALSVGLFVALLLRAVPARSRAVRARMDELGLDGMFSADAAARRTRRQSKLRDVLRYLGEQMETRGNDWSRLRRRLIHAGYRDPKAIPMFLGIRYGGTALLAFYGLLLGMAADLSSGFALSVSVFAAFSGFFLPQFMVSVRITRRQQELQKALPDALDLLVICVEAGLGLNQALLRVAEEIRHVSHLMTKELALTNLEIRAGTPRDQALMNLAERTGLPDIRSLATMLIQTERFGTSIARSLRVHAGTMRTKRRQRAEEAAAKTTIKMVFPLAFCIFPALFVVVLGPALISMMQSFSRLN